VCALVEILDSRLAHHREAALQPGQILPAEHLVRRSGTPGHNGVILSNSPFVRLDARIFPVYQHWQSDMGNKTKQKQSESPTMRYLNSSVHGMVLVLRAGGDTYLWMPATSGGENVWRRVSTTGISPGSARKRIALKAESYMNSGIAIDTSFGKERRSDFSTFQKLRSSGRSVN